MCHAYINFIIISHFIKSSQSLPFEFVWIIIIFRPTHHRTSKRERDDNRLTKLMALIFLCFLFCFLPLMLVNVFDDKVAYPEVHVLASILAWASSVINPFIYAATNKQYRSAYKKLLTIVRSSVASRSNSMHSNSLRSKQEKVQSLSFRLKNSSSAAL